MNAMVGLRCYMNSLRHTSYMFSNQTRQIVAAVWPHLSITTFRTLKFGVWMNIMFSKWLSKNKNVCLLYKFQIGLGHQPQMQQHTTATNATEKKLRLRVSQTAFAIQYPNASLKVPCGGASSSPRPRIPVAEATSGLELEMSSARPLPTKLHLTWELASVIYQRLA